MRTVADVARSALAAVGAVAELPLVVTFVKDRYAELVARARFRHLRELGEITVPAAITAGSVTIARGSKVVAGDATAQAAWSSSLAWRYFQAASGWYEIASFDGTSLRLTSEYAEDDVSSGSYKIVARYLDLPAGVRAITDVIHDRRRTRPLDLISLSELNSFAPDRLYVTSGPRKVAEIGQLPDGRKKIEVYPYSTDDELLHYVYFNAPKELRQDDVIPGVVDPYVLREGVLVDILRREAAQIARAGNAELAGFWLNAASRQQTVWESKVLEARLADKAIDDVGVVAVNSRRASLIGDVKDARAEVFARGARP